MRRGKHFGVSLGDGSNNSLTSDDLVTEDPSRSCRQTHAWFHSLNCWVRRSRRLHSHRRRRARDHRTGPRARTRRRNRRPAMNPLLLNGFQDGEGSRNRLAQSPPLPCLIAQVQAAPRPARRRPSMSTPLIGVVPAKVYLLASRRSMSWLMGSGWVQRAVRGSWYRAPKW